MLPGAPEHELAPSAHHGWLTGDPWARFDQGGGGRSKGGNFVAAFPPAASSRDWVR
jgi:hypothetical protein